MTRSSLRRSVSLAAALLLAGCLGDSTAPTHPQVARLALAPVFQTRSSLFVSFTRVRITLSREVSTALDTVVAFPATSDSLLLTLLVPISGSSETLTLNLMMINAAGDTVFRGGPIPVTATSGAINRSPPVAVAVRYVGIGANARSVLIATRTASVFFRDSVRLTATALDSSGEPIPGTPIVWQSLDPTLATVPVDTSGKVVGGIARGVARIRALLLTNQADTARVTVQPVAAALGLVSGSGQTGTVGTLLALPVVARVKAADSLPVSTVFVHFAATLGGGTVSPDSVATDSAGLAQAQWTLGLTAGAQTLQASVTGISGTVTYSATAVARPAATLGFTTQPPTSTSFQTPFGFTVTARDSAGNTATGFTGAVTVAIATNPAGGTLSGSLTQNAVAGVATFSGVSLDNIGSGYTLRASATGPTSATSSAFAIVAPPNVNAWVNTAGGNWSVAGNWSKGTVPVATDTVAIKQSGTYTVTLDANGTAARLDVGAPLGAQTLFLNGFKVALTGGFSTLTNGVVRMANALDSLGIGGSSSFGGGASTLSAGTLSVGGDFIQSGAANSFAPTGTTVFLTGSAASQKITFTDPTNSFFRRLQITKTAGGVVLGTNVRASFFRVASATAVTGPTVRLLTDTVYSPNLNSSITPLAVEITAALGDSGGTGFSPDTTVFTGASQSISPNNTTFLPYAYKSIRVAQPSGTATLAGNLTLPNDLVVSSGTLSLNRFAVGVAGNFRTEGAGVLAMTSPTDSLGVGGNVTFSGGSTAGTLTTGIITVGGNFAQTGTGAVFAPSGTHRVRFGRSTAGVQTIQFADPLNSFFRDLVLNRPTMDTVRLLSDAQVTDSATVTGSSVLASTLLEALKLPATGVLREPNTVAVIRPSRVEFGILQVDSAFTGSAGRIRPDTAVFLNGGSITSASPAYAWRSVRLAGGTLASSGTTYSGNLILSAGTYTAPISGAIDSIGGFLRTEGTGVLVMPVGTVPPTVAVRDSAVFAGGSEGGQLISGTLRINGSFVQRGPTTTSFQASGAHTTQFEGATNQRVTFANPGAAASTFNNLLLARASGGLPQVTRITLGSPIFVAGTVQDTSFGVADSIIGGGGGDSVTTNGFSLTNTVFSNAPVNVLNSTQLLAGTVVTFANMAPTVVQLTMSRGSGTITLASFAFLVAPTGTGKYFSATSTATAGPVTYTFSTPVQPPASSPPSAGQYLRLGTPAAVVVWGTTTLP